MTTRSFTTPARRGFLAACMVAAAFLPMPDTYGQAPRAPVAASPVPGDGPHIRAPVNPQRLSCRDLKAELKSAGEMSILSGPGGGWGDTFYGPAVPRCQFWQMPQFAYVRAQDGLCGVGYICIDKFSMD